ncbi:MAG TPA: phosphoketolase family protein, partial [Acidimicrobiales bacterium]
MATALPVAAPASTDDLAVVDAWWRAANYLSVGQIYLLDNPLLREPLALGHVKPRLLGHWGTTPGLNLVYAHLNRVIRARDLSAIYVCGPGHGGPGMVANAYLEGTYSEIYREVGQDEAGLRRLFRQFSFPGGVPSHAAPETPGSINEGGELGYSLAHAYGAAFDNPDLLVACVVGDGEAETGPLAASWHSNKFLNPATDGAVLPILHLNGYKIANPAVLDRIPDGELVSLFEGYGHSVHVVAGDEPAAVHRALADTLDAALDEIAAIQQAWRGGDGPAADRRERPRWPMIVLRTPKGWTGPKVVDGRQVEGTYRSHQVPLAGLAAEPEHLRLLEEWMRSYRPEELFDDRGALRTWIEALAPDGDRRMSANPHANGGRLRHDLDLPDFRGYAADVPAPGRSSSEPTRVLGGWLRHVVAANTDRFRIMGPDETASNRLTSVFEATDRAWMGATEQGDDHLAPSGRVMEVLSEHLCEGWLEGYLLTGRHGLFNCYEAFIHIVDSMFNQHAKWLGVSRRLGWREPVPSLNYLLSSHVWRQDHNGFSHQDPGFLDIVANKKAEVVRIYLPPDANTLLSTMNHCLRTVDYVNVVVAGKNDMPNWLPMDAAVAHCRAGLGPWDWASSPGVAAGGEPDVVLACCGDVPTLETLAAVDLMRQHLPDLAVRVVNVVDLMRLQPPSEHPHGLGDADFDALFTRDKPIVFAFHGYPSLVHQLTYRRTNHANLHVRGYKEEGTTTTPFDMVM